MLDNWLLMAPAFCPWAAVFIALVSSCGPTMALVLMVSEALLADWLLTLKVALHFNVTDPTTVVDESAKLAEMLTALFAAKEVGPAFGPARHQLLPGE